MWVLDYKESWTPKNWCFWTVVLEKNFESPLDSKAIQPVHPRENQSWIFIGRTDTEAETPILWSPDVKNWLIWKDPDAGTDWSQEMGMTEDEMASPTQRTWVWISSGSWWWTGKPSVLQSMGSQRVRHNWGTELNCNQEGLILNLHWICFCDFNPYLAAFVILGIHNALPQGDNLNPPTCEGLTFLNPLCGKWHSTWPLNCCLLVRPRNSHLRRPES